MTDQERGLLRSYCETTLEVSLAASKLKHIYLDPKAVYSELRRKVESANRVRDAAKLELDLFRAARDEDSSRLTQV